MLWPVLPSGQYQFTVPPTGTLYWAGSNRLPPSLRTRIVLPAPGSGVVSARKPITIPPPSTRAEANCWAKRSMVVHAVAAAPSPSVWTLAGETEPSVVSQMTLTPGTGLPSRVTTTRRLSGSGCPAMPTWCPRWPPPASRSPGWRGLVRSGRWRRTRSRRGKPGRGRSSEWVPVSCSRRRSGRVGMDGPGRAPPHRCRS